MTKELRFRLEDIPIDGRDVDVELEPAWLADRLGASEAAAGGPTRVVGRLEFAGNKIVFRGRIETTWQFQCSRCAADTSAAVTASFAHVFASRDDHTRDEVSDDGMTWFEGHGFDAEPVIGEELMLALPDYPMCSDDCKGLCERCGADLNGGPCGCEPAEDPRWAKLKQIKLS